MKCLNYWSGVINWVRKPVSEYWGQIIAHSEWECRLLSWAEKIYSDEIQLVRGKLWQSEHRQIKIKTWLRNIKHTLINLVWVQIHNAMKDIPRNCNNNGLGSSLKSLWWNMSNASIDPNTASVNMNIPIQSQGGITCEAIDEPRKSSYAINERVIINFRDIVLRELHSYTL